MKTNFNYINNNMHTSNSLLAKRKMALGQDKSKNTIENKNTKHRPAQAISFSGSAVSTAQKGVKKVFNKTVEFVYDNEAAYNAIYALIVAGILKPMAVLNMPGSEDKDKQIVATKNFLQAFIGCFLSYTIGGGLIKKAIDVVKNNLKLIEGVDENNKLKVLKADSTKALELAKDVLKKEGNKNPTIDEVANKAGNLVENFKKNHLKAFESNPEFVKNLKDKTAGIKSTYSDAFEALWKNSTGAITAIAKAKVSSLLLPGVMAFLFAKKNLEKEMQEKAKQATLVSNTAFKNEQEQFKKMMNKNSSNVSFKGSANVLPGLIDGTASLIEKLGMSKAGADLAKFVAKFKKPSARMSDFESFAITGYWLQNTARSKKIEPSQKLGLNVHTALVTIVSSTAALIIDSALDGVIDKSKDNYKERLIEIAKANPRKSANTAGVDEVLKDLPETLKMGIIDEISKVLENKEPVNGVAEITADEINEIVERLMKFDVFKKVNFSDKALVEQAAESLKETVPLRQSIANSCADMIGAKDIAKKLSKAIGSGANIDKVVDDLTKTYGKKLAKFKSLTIFTLVVRFLVPVLMVPFSGKLKKKIIEWTGGKAVSNNSDKK